MTNGHRFTKADTLKLREKGLKLQGWFANFVTDKKFVIISFFFPVKVHNFIPKI